MTHTDNPTLSHIRASRPIVPSESLVHFLKSANKRLREEDFEDVDPLLEPRIYALSSLRLTLFERRARAGQDATDLLTKLHVIMAQDKITTNERRRARPGVFESNLKTRPNPLPIDLADIAARYATDGKITLRADAIMDSTENDYRGSGTQLGLVLCDTDGLKALEAQHEHLNSFAARINAGKSLERPAEQDRPLHIPFMVAPFDSVTQRDDFIDLLNDEMPVFDIGVGPIDWDLKLKA